jgi:hypothetical protein
MPDRPGQPIRAELLNSMDSPAFITDNTQLTVWLPNCNIYGVLRKRRKRRLTMTTNEQEVMNPRPSNGLVTKILIGGAFVAALGGLWFQSTQVSAVRNELAGTQQKMDQLRGQMDTSVAMAKAEANESVSRLNDELTKTQRDAQAQAARAAAATKQQAGQLLTTLNTKNQELVQQLDQVKKENELKATKVDETLTGIKGDVGTVKTEVASTRTELDKTIADLRRVNGDMGVMSGLIATNSTELDALKKLGDREYFEFTISKNDAAKKIGGIQLALKKADVKRNRFTMDVLADDRKVEKKDKGVNEPVQFYTSSARIPYEVVVNQIGKDKVSGYLSVPKVKIIAQR